MIAIKITESKPPIKVAFLGRFEAQQHFCISGLILILCLLLRCDLFVFHNSNSEGYNAVVEEVRQKWGGGGMKYSAPNINI